MELIPPEMRPQLGLVAEMNPVVSMERAGTSAGRVANPSLSGWERMAAAGDTLSNMAGVVGPAAVARRVGVPVANAVQETLLGMAMSPEAVAAKNVGNAVVERLNQPGPMPTTYSNPIFGLSSRQDASEIFGPGTARAMYTDPETGGYMEILERQNGPASVLELFVPEEKRGQGGGKRLLEEVMKNYPRLMGQVSSKAAAKNAYEAGRRPPQMPNATLDDVFRLIDEESSVNMMSQAELAARGIVASPPPTAFDDWIDSFYTAEARKARSEGRGEPLVKPDIVYRGVSPQELENAVREGAFRANGAGVFVEPDPTRYVGGGAYGAKNQGAILQFDVSGLPKREMTGGIGTGDTLGYDAIPFDRVKMAWFWDANKKAHVLRPINE